MISASNYVKTNQIINLASDVPRYPISVKGLINLANRKKLPADVIDFYRAFPDTAVFDDADDVVARTEQVSILRNEKQPLEDAVRGAED